MPVNESCDLPQYRVCILEQSNIMSSNIPAGRIYMYGKRLTNELGNANGKLPLSFDILCFRMVLCIIAIFAVADSILYSPSPIVQVLHLYDTFYAIYVAMNVLSSNVSRVKFKTYSVQ